MTRIARRLAACVATAALAVLSLTFAPGGVRAQDAPKGDAANGKRIYLADQCFTCHGRAGQGGAFNGLAPILAKTEMPFDGFLGQLRNPSNDMPAYSTAVLSDQQAADIYAFLQTLPGPRDPKGIAVLND